MTDMVLCTSQMILGTLRRTHDNVNWKRRHNIYFYYSNIIIVAMCCSRRPSCAAIYLHGRMWLRGQNTIARHGQILFFPYFSGNKNCFKSFIVAFMIVNIYSRIYWRAVCWRLTHSYDKFTVCRRLIIILMFPVFLAVSVKL